ncbi:hypothetical protein [Lysinibacillus sp. CTST325]
MVEIFPELDLSKSIIFLISLSMLAIGIAFMVGFTVKKMLQFLKSF